MGRSEEADHLRRLLTRLTTRFSDFSSDDYGNPKVEPIRPVGESTIATSNLSDTGRHALVIDIDHPAWLVRSSTPGHYHLYVDVPGGIADSDYWHLLGQMADAGVIERGYYRASRRRGYSAVRLPWIKKQKPPVPVAPVPVAPADIWDEVE